MQRGPLLVASRTPAHFTGPDGGAKSQGALCRTTVGNTPKHKDTLNRTSPNLSAASLGNNRFSRLREQSPSQAWRNRLPSRTQTAVENYAAFGDSSDLPLSKTNAEFVQRKLRSFILLAARQFVDEQSKISASVQETDTSCERL